MNNELTEAERAVAEILLGHTIGWEDKAREIVAAVRPILAAEALETMAGELEPHVNIEHQEVWPFVLELRFEANRLRNP